LWRLPEYVNAANNNPGYLKDLNEKARRYPSPTLSVGRFAGELIVALAKFVLYFRVLYKISHLLLPLMVVQ
jgi:hypothetical protein